MRQAFIDQPGWQCWPFWVLELTPEASTADIEKAARNITGKLEFGVEQAARFLSPDGDRERDVYLVRDAKSALQDPQTRLLAEFWYFSPELANTPEEEGAGAPSPTTDVGWLQYLGVRL